MTLYICLDDRNGLRFNKRRQSRDAALLEDIRSRLAGKLLVAPGSETLMEQAGIPYVLPPETAQDFFLEDVPSEEVLSGCSKVVIYRWNRHYPADVRWDPDLTERGFSLEETLDFSGKSHEKITREVYVK